MNVLCLLMYLVRLESHGLCGEGSQFTVQAGLVVVQGTDGDRSFGCLSFRPPGLKRGGVSCTPGNPKATLSVSPLKI